MTAKSGLAVRERRLLRLADRLDNDGADAETCVRRFRVAAGMPGHTVRVPVELRVPDPPSGTVEVRFSVHSVTQWQRLEPILRESLDAQTLADARATLSDAELRRPRARRRPRLTTTITRTLAIHFLSIAGGGRLSPDAAAGLYASQRPDDRWDASEHARILRELEREYGPLTIAGWERMLGRLGIGLRRVPARRAPTG